MWPADKSWSVSKVVKYALGSVVALLFIVLGECLWILAEFVPSAEAWTENRLDDMEDALERMDAWVNGDSHAG